MDAQTLAIVSGVVLLIVFALVGLNMKNHNFWMIIGCVLPLLLIFLLPLFGIRSGGLLLIFLILCFGMHLLMMGGHKNHRDGGDESRKGGGHHGGH